MKKADKVSDHIPVLLSDFSSLLPEVSGVWIDGTFGYGGYSRGLLNSGATKVIAIDMDPDVLSRAKDFEKKWPKKFQILAGNFCYMNELVANLGLKSVSGVILDVGISSMQVDYPSRGFSFKHDGPLDMRMSKKGASAKDLINKAKESLISEILLKYGEERYAKVIAKRIVEVRKEYPIDSTHKLASLIEQVLGTNQQHKIHPATRSFQAIRMAINNELPNLIRGLASATELLEMGGLLAVITFHSLEDRIVKRFFNLRTKNSSTLDEIKRIGGNSEPIFKKVNKRPVIPNLQEISKNPRARSAKLRIVRKMKNQFIDLEPSSLGLPNISASLREFQCE